MIKITSDFLKEMMDKARQSPRGRINHNFHFGPGDPLQRMLNSMQHDTYLQPHKHENPDKREVFMALTGKFVVIQFNENGSITDHMILDPKNNEYAAEIPARTYHTIICLEPDSIIYEIKDGPYDPADDKQFASWAPKEGEAGCEDYLNSLLNKLEITMINS
jgi:cupin fold WbuC family metalloprotein